MSEHNRDRSASGGIDDSDFESQIGDTNQPGKPGRKKKANSQAARRDQNRIAQREFRLRKQQRIRDLEARVEILSGPRDEALGEMRHILKELMAENHTLRGLLRNLASFIGDGGGGLLPKMGWNLQDFNKFINKGETDTAWEGYQRRKKAKPAEPEASSSSNFVANSTGQKRRSEVDINSSTKKRRSDDKEFDSNNSGGFPSVVPLASSPQTTSLYSPTRQQDQNFFSDLMRSADTSPLFIPPANPTAQYPNSGLDGYSRSYMPQVNVGVEKTPSSFYEPPSNPVAQPNLQQSSDNAAGDEIEEEDDPKKHEAYKLINYHLENYKRNSSYCLPASLRPTIVQRTMPHESVIDLVLHPELRDRMILLRQRYDLVDCLVDMRAATTIHGDDILAHHNWELSQKFIRKYSFLVDTPLLKIVNRWRRERGDPEIILPENAGERT